MAVNSEGAPSWLFSFVDLAFLMLIAMTQLAGDVDEAPDLGEMVVPRIGAESSAPISMGSALSWQVRVHPRDEGPQPGLPFELVRIGSAGTSDSEFYGQAVELRGRLEELERSSGDRPLLAPHEDSRSQDLLDAAALIEEFWPGRRRVTVARVFDS